MAKCKTIEELFWRNVQKSKGCWKWIGCIRGYGYGVISSGPRGNSKTYPSHRVSWVIHNGDIPKGMLICHKCDIPSCVNPSHLFLGTAKDNFNDAIKKGRNNPHHIKNRLRGSKHQFSKLTEEQVIEIIKEARSKNRKFGYAKPLAEKFNVSLATIYGLAESKRSSWKHISYSSKP